MRYDMKITAKTPPVAITTLAIFRRLISTIGCTCVTSPPSTTTVCSFSLPVLSVTRTLSIFSPGLSYHALIRDSIPPLALGPVESRVSACHQHLGISPVLRERSNTYRYGRRWQHQRFTVTVR